jgi:hypothetical protein
MQGFRLPPQERLVLRAHVHVEARSRADPDAEDQDLLHISAAMSVPIPKASTQEPVGELAQDLLIHLDLGVQCGHRRPMALRGR